MRYLIMVNNMLCNMTQHVSNMVLEALLICHLRLDDAALLSCSQFEGKPVISHTTSIGLK